MGRGCGSVGRAVASDTTGLQFESRLGMAHLKQKEVRVGPNLKKMHNFDKVESDLCVTQIQAMTDRRQRRRGSATVKTGLTTSLTSPHVGSRLSGDLVRQSV